MYNRAVLDLLIARDKLRDLMRQAEQERLIRTVRARHRARTKAGPRAWDRLTCWLRQLRQGRDAARSPRSADHYPYLLNALAWMTAKE